MQEWVRCFLRCQSIWKELSMADSIGMTEVVNILILQFANFNF